MGKCHRVACAKSGVLAQDGLVDTVAHDDQRHAGRGLVTQRGDVGKVGGRRRAADQELGVDLLERVGNVAQPGDPGAVRGDAGIAQQAVQCLDRVACSAVHQYRHGSRVVQATSSAARSLRRQQGKL
jgi:hypothetical protein